MKLHEASWGCNHGEQKPHWVVCSNWTTISTENLQIKDPSETGVKTVREGVKRVCPVLLFPYGVMLFKIFCCILLRIASNLSNKDDAVCLGILQEHLQTVYEICAIEWISANTWKRAK